MSDMPWVRFFPSDWLAGTRGMTASETGIYITLIATMYERGEPVPEDHARLARLCGASAVAFKRALDTLVAEGKVERANGCIWNGRVGKETTFRAEKSEVGSRAANARWGKKDSNIKSSGDANALRPECAGDANQKPDTIKNPSSLRSDGGARKRASRLPEDWQLPDEWQQDAIDAGLSVARIAVEAAKMRDWSRSAPTGAKLDWRAAWRNWCRKSASDAPLPRGSPRQSVPDLAELFAMAGERVSDERPAENFTGSRQALPNLSLVRSGRNGG